MKSREPAGQERGGGRSAELPVRARAEGGPVRNTPGTVRGTSRGSAIRLQGTPRLIWCAKLNASVRQANVRRRAKYRFVHCEV